MQATKQAQIPKMKPSSIAFVKKRRANPIIEIKAGIVVNLTILLFSLLVKPVIQRSKNKFVLIAIIHR